MANRGWGQRKSEEKYLKGSLLHLLSYECWRKHLRCDCGETELFKSPLDSWAAVSEGDLHAGSLLASSLKINTCGEAKAAHLGC